MTTTAARQGINDFCTDNWPDDVIWLIGDSTGDPCDAGFLGVGYQQHRGPIAVYDRERCIDALAKSFALAPHIDCKGLGAGMVRCSCSPYTDAIEYFDFNIAGNWIGPETPLIVQSLLTPDPAVKSFAAFYPG